LEKETFQKEESDGAKEEEEKKQEEEPEVDKVPTSPVVKKNE